MGCNPYCETTVARLRQLKQRDPAKGLILVAAAAEQFGQFLANLPNNLQQRLNDSWPGPNTWLVPCGPDYPWLTGNFSTIALRVTAHPLVVALCRRLGHPLVSTSANPEGKPPARSCRQVRAYFANELDYLLLGETQGAANPSTIRDLASGKLVRVG